MTTASGRSRPRHTRLGARLQQVRRTREWLQDPFRTTRKNMAMRRELLKEARGGVGDLGKFLGQPAVKSYRRMHKRGEARFGTPVTSRDAKKHYQAKAEGQTAATSQQPPQPTPKPSNTPRVPRSTDVSQDVDASYEHNKAILDQLTKAVKGIPDLDLSHAHLFDQVTSGLGQLMLDMAEATRGLVEHLEIIRIDRQIVQSYEEAADHMSFGQQFVLQIRRQFRRRYWQYLKPDNMGTTPPPSFFDARK